MSKTYNVAVVGATGAVGREMIRQLEDRRFPIARLLPLASERSAGSKISFHGEDILVEELSPDKFDGIDIALFSAGGSVSRHYAHEAVQRGTVVIDNTSAFRMDEHVPLVVPEVNANKIRQHQGIIANPNCSTIQLVTALKPIYDRYRIKRILVSTYQAVSGAGKSAMDELMQQIRATFEQKPLEATVLPVRSLPVKYPIAFNAIPQIDVFMENGFTFEEMKMVNETKKIFDDSTIEIAATCVRIPILIGHSESVYIETEEDVDIETITNVLRNAKGVIVIDDPKQQAYPMAIHAAGKREVFVGRIRRDLDRKNGFHMWIVADNLLKGAAWNSVQIAEHLITHKIDGQNGL